MKPKILILDIETSPLVGFFWGLRYNDNIGLNQLAADWQVLSIAYKWLGEKKVYYIDQKKKIPKSDNPLVGVMKLNDKAVIKKIWKLLDRADIVITKNGSRFDIPKLNDRFEVHRLGPYSSFQHVDLETEGRKYFGYTSHKLEYIAEHLSLPHRKLVKREFEGMVLWTECLKGNSKAWAEMKKYNMLDTLVNEDLFARYHPWGNKINPTIYSGGPSTECACGSKKFRKIGFFYSATGRYQRYRCTGCHSEWRARKMLKPANTPRNPKVRTNR